MSRTPVARLAALTGGNDGTLFMNLVEWEGIEPSSLWLFPNLCAQSIPLFGGDIG